MDAQALQYAKLDPFQQANYAIGRGASGLAGAIGGALGGQDPELQRITRAQQIAGQIDYNNDDSMKQAIVALNNAGDPQSAMQLQQILLSQQAKRASIGKDEAAARASDAAATRDRTKAPPEKVQLAREVALLSGPEGSIEYNTAFAISLKEQVAGKVPLEPKTTIQKLQEYAKTLTPGSIELAQVMAVIKAEGEGKGTKVDVTLPGVKGAGDVIKLRSDINTTLKPFRDGVNAANQAIALADDVLLTGNFASSASLARALAKASGETQLSKADVAAFGGDPSFVGGIADIANRLATGTPSADTTRKLKSLAVLLKKKNESLEKTEIKQLQKTAELSELYTPKQIKELFTLRGETKATTRKTAGGVSYTVED